MTQPRLQYTLENQLSLSLSGEIYQAKTHHGKSVVIKISDLSKRFVNKEENPMREAAILKSLGTCKFEPGSDYIIKLFDDFSVDRMGTQFFCSVLEFAERGDLLKCVEMRKLSLKTVQRYLLQAVEGVNFIHKQGYCHLDLSLENILITDQGHIRICDFGQAMRQRFFKLNQPRKGKLRYMSPEIYNQLAYDGFKADVWSLGVILWALLTGFLLYFRPDETDANFRELAKGKNGIKKLLGALPIGKTPSSIINLLSGMLAVNPTDRFTIQEVLAHPWLRQNKRRSPPHASRRRLRVVIPRSLSDGAINYEMKETP